MSVLFLLLLVGTAMAQYTNQPIFPSSTNPEILDSGVVFFFEGSNILLPGERGWCRTNSDCGGAPPNEDTCYSQFYTDVPGVDVGFTYPHCSSPSLSNFGDYNMTFNARTFLIDLDINGYPALVQGAPNEEQHATCLAQFPDLCYVTMWVNNIRAGFSCENEGELFKMQELLPPCRSFCHSTINGGCSSFRDSILRRGETVLMYCEVLPTSNCVSAANSIKPSFIFALFAVAFTLLWSRT